jgi:(E)-4-hydroxy-3-methylbut-2-enyl-diphosphate synthase
VEQSIVVLKRVPTCTHYSTQQKRSREFTQHKNELRKRGYNTPLVADIHFTPNAAEIAARIVEKVRVNPAIMLTRKNSSK